MSQIPIKTEKTEIRYRARFLQLQRKCAIELGFPEVDVITTTGWLIGKRASIARATWRQYKAVLIFELQHQVLIPPVETAIIDCLKSLTAETQAGAVKSTDRTSGSKQKRFPLAERQRIFLELFRSRSKSTEALRHFIVATCACGLRPEEWRVAHLKDAEAGFAVKLIIENAKATNGRAHGETRTLRWAQMNHDLRHSIESTIALAHAFSTDDEYEVFRKQLQELLRQIDRKLWARRKTHYTLYSCRHQFAAEAKLAFSPDEVGAMMGHASDETATKHYGRFKRSKSGPDVEKVLSRNTDLPLPDPHEVALVRRLIAKSKDKLYDHLLGRNNRHAVVPAEQPEENAVQMPASGTAVETHFGFDELPVPETKNAQNATAQRSAGRQLNEDRKAKLARELDEILAKSLANARSTTSKPEK